MKKALLFFTILSFLSPAFGQGESNIWKTGYATFDFNALPATLTYDTNYFLGNQAATRCDEQGNLLFYTNGCKVWDKNGNIMPNGYSLADIACNYCDSSGYISSSFQVPLSPSNLQIVPNPANANQYFVISALDYQYNFYTQSKRIVYNLVDMSLNGGLGDVLTSPAKVVINLPSLPTIRTSFITKGSCADYWYIVSTDAYGDSPKLYAFHIDQFGNFDTIPAITVCPVGPGGSSVLNMKTFKFYFDQPVLFAASQMNSASMFRVNFDRQTGLFSNFESFDAFENITSIEFSPDGRYLYVGGTQVQANLGNAIFQYDLQMYPNLANITASGILIGQITNTYSGYNFFDNFELGADGKIYIRCRNVNLINNQVLNIISTIESPNTNGIGCNFLENALVVPMLPTPFANFTPITSYGYVGTLGSHTISRNIRDTVSTIIVPIQLSQICTGDSILLEGPNYLNSSFYKWSDGSNDSQLVVTQPGTYWLQTFSSDCKIYIDSFVVFQLFSLLNRASDTTICAGDSIVLNAYQPEFTSYSWSNGSSSPSITVYDSGVYIVSATKNNCVLHDTITVHVFTPQFDILQNDSTICKGQIFVLNTQTNMPNPIKWNTGVFADSFEVTQEGKYSAQTQNFCGTFSDSVFISQIDCECIPFAPTVFSPNNDGKNDFFLPKFKDECQERYFEMVIFNRYGQVVKTIYDKSMGWDGKYANGKNADVGVYFYTLKIINSYGNYLPALHKGEITLVR